MRASTAAVSSSSVKAGGSARSSRRRSRTRASSVLPPPARQRSWVCWSMSRRLPERAVPLSRHAPREVVAARADRVDLVEGEGCVVEGEAVEDGAGVAGELVAEHHGLERALQARLEVADVVQEGGAARASR